MPNKFQKSVLERQKTESERKQSAFVSLVSQDDTEALKQTEPCFEEPAVTHLVSASTKAEGINSFIRPRATRTAKNKTFYLDNELIQLIQSTAKSQEITESRLVNDILRSVLGL